MSFAGTVALGAIAGSTIFIGLPIGRARRLSPRARVGLSMLSAGILAFLFMDVGAEGLGIIETHLDAYKEHEATLWPVIGLFALLSVGFLAGVGGIATAQRRLQRSSFRRPPIAGGESATAMSAAEIHDQRRAFESVERAALRTAMVIAVAIGLHNFAEGLAIGVSAQAGEIGLATVLIIGFALHNATEGFGIVAPLAGQADPPSWRFLALLGLIGGGPTFVGTLIGQSWVSESLSIAFLALAAGSILYVVVELMNINRQLASKTVVMWGLLAGLVLGFATEFVVAAAGV